MKRTLAVAAEWAFVAGLALVVGVTFAVVGVMYLREHLRRART